MRRTSVSSGPSKIRFQNGNRSAFYQALRQRVNAHLATRRSGRHADWRLWTKGAVYFALAAGAYGGICAGSLPSGGCSAVP